MNRFDALDMDLDLMHDDVIVDEENLGFCSGFRVYNGFRNFGRFSLKDGRLSKT